MPTPIPDLDQSLTGGPGLAPPTAAAMDNDQPGELHPAWEDLLDLDLDLGMNFDANLWPDILEIRPSMDRFDNIWLASMESDLAPAANTVVRATQLPTPLTPCRGGRDLPANYAPMSTGSARIKTKTAGNFG